MDSVYFSGVVFSGDALICLALLKTFCCSFEKANPKIGMISGASPCEFFVSETKTALV